MTVAPQPAEAAVALLRPADTLAVPLGPGQPSTFLHALAGRSDWVDLRVFGALLVDLFEVLRRPGVRYLSGFFGPAERALYDGGAPVEFVPAGFRGFQTVLDRMRPRVMATLAAPPDPDGWLSLSVHAGATYWELQRAAADPGRLLVVEVNEACPRTHGLPPEYPHRLHVDQVDVLVQGEHPLLTLPQPVPTADEQEVARLARGLVSDGCTLQTGIGSIPATVATLLAESDGSDYGIHSEMFTDGLMRLHQAGKVSNARKGMFDGASICTFAAGSAELYGWLDGNESVRFLPVDVVNSPEVLKGNRRMVAINGALSIDLFGQVVADTIDGTQFSGIGGHEDFVSVAALELEDRSLVCLPSTAVVGGLTVSRIVPQLQPGWVVTTPRHQLDVVVTEHGVAELRGRSVRERARALAGIAHPDFRRELLDQAARLR
jgi:acyl-CoA hydrolase